MTSNWDDSSDDDNNAPPKQPTQKPANQTSKANEWDDSSEDNNDEPTQNQTNKNTQKPNTFENDSSDDDEPSHKQQSKQQIEQPKPKPKPKQSQTQSTKSENNNNNKKITNDNDSDTTSSDSDSNDEIEQKKNVNSGMQSYDARNTEDNAILFGIGGNQRQDAPKREMLSGDVKLTNFPLGSQQDCIKLAKEITAVMNAHKFDKNINTIDIVKFVSYIIEGLINKNSKDMDIVDINEIKKQIDKIYNAKQKQIRAHKKPKKQIHKFGKFKGFPSQSQEQNQGNTQGTGRYVEGQYNANDFDFLN